jgi:hypothetical protein
MRDRLVMQVLSILQQQWMHHAVSLLLRLRLVLVSCS